MTLEKDISKLYEDKKSPVIHSYIRPVFILVCCIIAFYAFRVIVLDYMTGENDINIYAAENSMEEGNFKRAEEILNQVLAKQPNFSSANKMLGFLCLQQNRLDEALAYYQKASEYSPKREEIENAISLITERKKE